MKLTLEIRAAEGGDDAKLLVNDQAAVYTAFAARIAAKVRVADSGPGWLNLELDGPADKLDILRNEAGGHRWQRVPPTERKGRVHTSTVTVAVMQSAQPKSPTAQHPALPEKDVDIRLTKDSGPGGQHRNKTESCVVMTHKPTGLQAKASSKCQHQNRREARAMLEERVGQHYAQQAFAEQSAERRQQVGTGQRGDKVRTYRTQDDSVVDQRSGLRARLRDVVSGKLELLVA
jgi:peptide chain release factor 1